MQAPIPPVPTFTNTKLSTPRASPSPLLANHGIVFTLVVDDDMNAQNRPASRSRT